MSAPKVSSRALYVVFIVLMALLVLTVGLSFVGEYAAAGKLPHFLWVTKLAGYPIAAAKAILVILFFMEVRHASRLTWVFAGAAFLWLGIMMVLSMSDYTTRGWTPNSEQLSHVEPIIPPPSR